MSLFKYSREEKKVNKVLKMNQDASLAMLGDAELSESRQRSDTCIDNAMTELRSLGYETELQQISSEAVERSADGRRFANRPEAVSWDKLVKEADISYSKRLVALEDIMSAEEIAASFRELEGINTEFSRKTGIINNTDLSLLAVAMALQVAKSLVFPYVAKQFDYGSSFDPTNRLAHNDKSIENAHRKANDQYRDKHLEKHDTGHWINLLYQTPPYDITRGSVDLNINMGGGYHRLHTLGHDPILGWLFGTMNILTDVITLNTLQSYRITRKPTMRITNESVSMGVMVRESYEWIRNDYLNLPAAVFAQAQHLKSDEYTKLGLPIPVLPVINESFAGDLYKSNYDALCFARDAKIIGGSFVTSRIIDMLITLVHGLFRTDQPQKLYEVRTRKILLVSNAAASTSSIVNTMITSNPKNLDIGSLLNAVAHLFADVRFITKIKDEYIRSDISTKIQHEMDEVDRLYVSI